MPAVEPVDRHVQPDPAQLFFIAKGRDSETILNTATERQSENNGIIYVTGYLGPDYSASGQIVITTDKTWSADYLWRTEQ